MGTPGWYQFSANVDNVVASANLDFFQLQGGPGLHWRLLEVRVWSRVDTALVSEDTKISIGTGGAGGGSVTPYQYNTDGADSSFIVRSSASFSTQVTALTWIHRSGWTRAGGGSTFLATPELEALGVSDSDLSLRVTGAVTQLSAQITWEEYQQFA